MAFTNTDAMKLVELVSWILHSPKCSGKQVTDQQAKAAARYLAEQASKTGCSSIPGDQWKRWPVRVDIFTRGTCAVCGCTDDHACEEGCSWVNGYCTLCSACAEKFGILELFTDSPLQMRIAGEIGNKVDK